MIKYIGSKRTLVPVIGRIAGSLGITSACDIFAGTTRVGQALRRCGVTVLSNDLASYSEVLGLAYVAADGAVDRERIRTLLAHLASLPGEHGYFTRTFCEQSRYFKPENGERVDAVRAEIDRLQLDRIERGMLLTSLLEAADRVDSTCGLQMAYLKYWAPRASNPLELREPQPVEGPAGEVVRRDANELAAELTGYDCTYIDPPYNQHSYFNNYHVWETLVRNDEPGCYGIACKRLDCRTTRSRYNSKKQASAALDDLIGRVATPWLIVSFNNEGFHDPAHVATLLAERGYVNTLEVDFKRYVGAQIGIYNPGGEKVGRVSHLRNKEVLFVVGPDRGRVARAFDAIGPAAGSPEPSAAGSC